MMKEKEEAAKKENPLMAMLNKTKYGDAMQQAHDDNKGEEKNKNEDLDGDGWAEGDEED